MSLGGTALGTHRVAEVCSARSGGWGLTNAWPCGECTSWRGVAMELSNGIKWLSGQSRAGDCPACRGGLSKLERANGRGRDSSD